jgi:hypothetical protein
MKIILAMALVGLLSISSLANQEPKLLINEVLPTSESNCPDEYKFIEGNSKIRGFCITKSVQTKMRLSLAKENCKEQVHDGREAFLCRFNEWKLACEKYGEELIMSQKNSGKLEWVADLYNDKEEVMGYSGCDSITSSAVNTSYVSRCCYR